MPVRIQCNSCPCNTQSVFYYRAKGLEACCEEILVANQRELVCHS